MKLKSILFLTLMASTLAAPTVFATYDGNADENTGTGDDAVDFQNVSVNVPEVALLDITATTGPAFVFTNPANAGAQFTMPAPDASSKLKYSSNVSTGKTRKVTVSIGSGGDITTLPANLILGISTSVSGNGSGTTAATSIDGATVTNPDLIAGITNHASGTTGYTVTYTPSLKSNETMIGHTGDAAKTIKLVYTLGTEQ